MVSDCPGWWRTFLGPFSTLSRKTEPTASRSYAISEVLDKLFKKTAGERMQASGTPNSKYMILKQTPEPEDLKANLFILWKRFYMV